MAENLGKWPSKRGPISKIKPSDGCGRDAVPLAWNGGTISKVLDGIWGMSAKGSTGKSPSIEELRRNVTKPSAQSRKAG